MNRKLFLLITVLLTGVLIFAGCNKKPTSDVNGTPEPEERSIVSLVPEDIGVGQFFINGDLEGEWVLAEGDEGEYQKIIIEDNYPEPPKALLYLAEDSEPLEVGIYSLRYSENEVSLHLVFDEEGALREEVYFYNFGYTLDGELLLQKSEDERIMLYRLQK